MNWRLSVAASRDLEDISAFISRDNPRAAQAWIDRIIERIEEACNQPRAGRMVPEFKHPDIREVFLRTYRIIYLVEPESLYIFRIMEGHQLLRSLQ